MRISSSRSVYRNREMKKNIWIFVLVFCFNPLLVRAEELAKMTGPAKTIMTKMIEAIGGQKKLSKVTSYDMDAEMVMPAMKMKMEMNMKVKKDKIWVKVELKGQVTSMKGFDGKTAWSKDPIMGLRKLEGREKLSFLQSSLKASMRPDTFYDEIIVKPGVQFDGKEVIECNYKKESLPDKTVYVDPKTYLILAQKSVEVSAQGEIPSLTRLSEYKTSPLGLRYASKMESEVGPMKAEINILRYEENVELKDDLFKMPEPVKLQVAE